MVTLGLLVCMLGWAAAEFDHGVDLPTKKPLNIAHRGASGTLPEHTLEAYRLAVKQGADIIECDISLTKDLVPICRHEGNLKAQTNVMDFPELKAKEKTYYIQDEDANFTDVHSVDMTLQEIKKLRVKQKYDFRDPNFNFKFQIPTLEEFIQVAKEAERPVGIYPELKDPVWINSLDIIKDNGTTFEELVVRILHNNGYNDERDPCFIQCFHEATVKSLSKLTKLPLVWLMDFGAEWRNDDEKLKEVSEFIYGIGVSKLMIIPGDPATRYLLSPTDLIKRAHKFNLKVHAYTFRNENKYLAYNYTQDPYNEYEKFFQLGLDGYFTDFPGSLNRYLNMDKEQTGNCNKDVSKGNSTFITPIFITLCILTISITAFKFLT